MNQHDIHLWYAFDDEISDISLIECYQQLLSHSERQKQQRFHFAKDRHQYLVTRALLRTVLSLYEPTVLPEQWCFDKNDYGKPFITYPLLKSPLFFNLSHTDGLIILAVSREVELGVDIECRKRASHSLSIANHFFSKKECEYLFGLPVHQQSDHFLTLWTLKESYIKARGMGLSIPLDQFSFSVTDWGEVTIDIEASQNDQQSLWSFWLMSLTDAYVGALALKSEFPKSYYVISQKKITPLLHMNPIHYSVL